MTELEKKEKEYSAYIQEHIGNVKLAYMKHGEKLCRLLNVSPFEVGERINKHDESKFSDEEFDAYRNWFHSYQGEERDKEAFEKAWEHHYTNNPHHPEYWSLVLKKDYMEPVYIAEMLLDWESMGMKFGNNTYEWYIENRDRKPIPEKTKKILDVIVKELFGGK